MRSTSHSRQVLDEVGARPAKAEVSCRLLRPKACSAFWSLPRMWELRACALLFFAGSEDGPVIRTGPVQRRENGSGPLPHYAPLLWSRSDMPHERLVRRPASVSRLSDTHTSNETHMRHALQPILLVLLWVSLRCLGPGLVRESTGRSALLRANHPLLCLSESLPTLITLLTAEVSSVCHPGAIVDGHASQ